MATCSRAIDGHRCPLIASVFRAICGAFKKSTDLRKKSLSFFARSSRVLLPGRDDPEEARNKNMKHDLRNANGQYKETHRCDGCGKPVGVDHETDEEVTGNTDGPGFFLCSRVRCTNKRDALSIQERRTLYTATRGGA